MLGGDERLTRWVVNDSTVEELVFGDDEGFTRNRGNLREKITPRLGSFQPPRGVMRLLLPEELPLHQLMACRIEICTYSPPIAVLMTEGMLYVLLGWYSLCQV